MYARQNLRIEPPIDVFVQESDTPWATRWDNYLHIFDPVSDEDSWEPRTLTVVCLAAYPLV